MVDQGPQRPDALLEMGFRFRRFARDRICVLQRLSQFRVAEKCVAVGAKSFLIGNPNWEHARRGRYDAEFLAVHSFHLLMISFSVFPDGGKESNACMLSGMSRNRYGHHKNFS